MTPRPSKGRALIINIGMRAWLLERKQTADAKKPVEEQERRAEYQTKEVLF